MERLITVKDVSERYGCSLPTARKYIRQCNPHMENPLVTYEWAFKDWEKGRMVYKTKNMTRKDFTEMKRMLENGRPIVPRTW